jgi:hypothetical protein
LPKAQRPARSIRVIAGGHGAKVGWSRLGYETLIVVFGCLIGMLAFSSAKTPWTGLVPSSWLAWFFTLGTVNPFLFAGGVLGMGTLDYVLKDGSVRRRRKADDLLLGLNEIVRQQTDADQLIEALQKRMSEFVEAERSTVYLFSQGPRQRARLRAVSVFGTPDSRAHVRREITPEGGIVGYVCQTQNALLIRNLASDVRFQNYLSERPKTEGSYKTGSCMVFPLVIGRQLVGVLTVADKQGQRKFNRRDFSILSLAAKDLALTLYARASRGGRRAYSAKLA